MLGLYPRRAYEQVDLLPKYYVVEAGDQWALNLSISIVKQAADDLRAAYRSHDESSIKTLTKWFRSEWGQLLSFGHGSFIAGRIKKEEEEREQNET